MKYAILKQDGSISLIDKGNADADINKEVEKHKANWTSPVVSITEVDTADIPADRSYRNGWTVSAGKIIHDMEKCRELHKNKMRTARAPKLAALDVEYQRADEIGDVQLKKDIAAKKKVLRDITSIPDIDAAQTVEELKKVWPEVLS